MISRIRRDYSVGGGVVAEFVRHLQLRNQMFTPHSMIFVGRDTHFAYKREKLPFLARKVFCSQVPSIPGDLFTIPGDLKITRHFWRLPEIPGDLAGLSIGRPTRQR